MHTRVETSVRSAFESSELPDDGDKNTRDQAMAAWAHLLAPIIQEARAFSAAPTPQSHGAHAPEAGEHATFDNGLVSAASGPSQTSDTPVNDPGPSRLVLSVTSDTLGQIELVIDRDKGGVTIWIGAAQDAQAIISTDKFALLQNLARSGVNVRALGVMSREAVGTVLAEGKLNAREETASRQGARTPDGKLRKRLSLIG